MISYSACVNLGVMFGFSGWFFMLYFYSVVLRDSLLFGYVYEIVIARSPVTNKPWKWNHDAYSVNKFMQLRRSFRLQLNMFYLKYRCTDN